MEEHGSDGHRPQHDEGEGRRLLDAALEECIKAATTTDDVDRSRSSFLELVSVPLLFLVRYVPSPAQLECCLQLETAAATLDAIVLRLSDVMTKDQVWPRGCCCVSSAPPTTVCEL